MRSRPLWDAVSAPSQNVQRDKLLLSKLRMYSFAYDLPDFCDLYLVFRFDPSAFAVDAPPACEPNYDIDEENHVVSAAFSSGNLNDPPFGAEKLLRWLLPAHQRDVIIGDLEEEFRVTVVVKYGIRSARRWYWFQAIRSIAPVLRGWIVRSSLLVAIGRAVAWIFGRYGI